MSVNVQLVSYDGVELPMASIGYSAQAEYDETGFILQGYTFTFHGVCFVIANPMTSTPANFQTALTNILQTLSKPQKRFIWSSGGQALFDVQAAPGTPGSLTAGQYYDRRYGPRPKVMPVKQIPGGLSARVEFEIECFITFCASTTLDVETFWWQFAYSFDRNYNATRTVTGKYQLRSPLQAAATYLPTGINFPALPNTFYRESINHQLSQDGRTITFTITDKQVWRTLPSPLSDGQASFRIELQPGGMMQKHLSCWFEAPNDVDKTTILQFIVALIQARFPDALNPVMQTDQEGKQNLGFLEFFRSFTFTNHEFQNRVECAVTSTRTNPASIWADKPNTNAILNAFFGDVSGIAPDGPSGDLWTASNGLAVRRSMLGTAGLLPSGNNPFSPCGNVTSPGEELLKQNADLVSPDSVNNANPTPGVINTELTDDGAGNKGGYPNNNSVVKGGSSTSQSYGQASLDNFQNPYTAYSETVHYLLDRHLVAIPIPYAPNPGSGVRPPSGTNGDIVQDAIQQTTQPQLTIIQVGTARRIGRQPDLPAPAKIDTNNGTNALAYVTKQEIRPREPRFLPDGQNIEFGLSWAYTILVPFVRNLVENRLSGSLGPGVTNVYAPVSPLIDSTYFQNYMEYSGYTGDDPSGVPDSQQGHLPVNADGTYGETISNAADLGNRDYYLPT